MLLGQDVRYVMLLGKEVQFCYAPPGTRSTVQLCSWDRKYSTVMLLGQEVQFCYASGTGSSVLLCSWYRKYSYVMLLVQEVQFCCSPGTGSTIMLCSLDRKGRSSSPGPTPILRGSLRNTSLTIQKTVCVCVCVFVCVTNTLVQPVPHKGVHESVAHRGPSLLQVFLPC